MSLTDEDLRRIRGLFKTPSFQESVGEVVWGGGAFQRTVRAVIQDVVSPLGTRLDGIDDRLDDLEKNQFDMLSLLKGLDAKVDKLANPQDRRRGSKPPEGLRMAAKETL